MLIKAKRINIFTGVNLSIVFQIGNIQLFRHAGFPSLGWTIYGLERFTPVKMLIYCANLGANDVMQKMRKMRNCAPLIFVAQKMRKFAPTRKSVALETLV